MFLYNRIPVASQPALPIATAVFVNTSEAAIQDSLGRRLCEALGMASQKRHAPKVRFNG